MTILAQSDAARTEAIDLAERSKVTTKVARSLVAKHTSTAPPPPPFRKPLAETSTPEEVFMVEGGVITIRPIGNATPSDMLGMLVQVQRQLRDRMLKAA
jgi:hypothetical protein